MTRKYFEQIAEAIARARDAMPNREGYASGA